MTNNTPIQKPAPFLQPILVACTSGCGRTVDFQAPSCPNCGRTDPALLRNDPQGRTLARKQYDESPLVVAWNNQIKAAEAKKEAEKRAEHEALLALEKQYNQGQNIVHEQAGKTTIGICALLLVLTTDKLIYDLPNLISIAVLALTVREAYKILDGWVMMKDAKNQGYKPPEPKPYTFNG